MGTKIGAQKTAAKKIGVSLDYYLQAIRVMKWCTAHKRFCMRNRFDRQTDRPDGLSTSCREGHQLLNSTKYRDRRIAWKRAWYARKKIQSGR